MHREVKKGLYDKSAIALETKELSELMCYGRTKKSAENPSHLKTVRICSLYPGA